MPDSDIVKHYKEATEGTAKPPFVITTGDIVNTLAGGRICEPLKVYAITNDGVIEMIEDPDA